MASICWFVKHFLDFAILAWFPAGQDWLAAGCGTVWIVAADRRTVTIYRRREAITVSRGEEAEATLNLGANLP